MNCAETSSTANCPLLPNGLGQSSAIHQSLSTVNLGWNMINEPGDWLDLYKKCKNDVAFPAKQSTCIRITCPQTPLTVKALGDWAIVISKDRPLTVRDVLKGLYEGVNRSTRLPDGMPPDERLSIGQAANLRLSTVQRSMSDSLDYSDQYAYKVVDFFYGMSCFAGLKQLSNGTWELNAVHSRFLYKWFSDQIEKASLASTVFGAYSLLPSYQPGLMALSSEVKYINNTSNSRSFIPTLKVNLFDAFNITGISYA